MNNYVVEIYQDKAGEYRWRLKASNGQIVADSGEGYVNLEHCTDMVSTMWKRFAEAEIHLYLEEATLNGDVLEMPNGTGIQIMEGAGHD